MKSEREVAQSCPSPSDPMDCSPPGSSVRRIFQARVLEWGAIAFSERTNPREYQVVRTHTGNHLNTRPSITQSPVAPCAGHFIYLNNKQNRKYKSNNQQTGLPPHSALSIRGKTNQNSAQISSYMKLTQTTGPTLGVQKPKGRKNSTLKPGKRRPQTQ